MMARIKTCHERVVIGKGLCGKTRNECFRADASGDEPPDVWSSEFFVVIPPPAIERDQDNGGAQIARVLTVEVLYECNKEDEQNRKTEAAHIRV